jgi:hypothetical protein
MLAVSENSRSSRGGTAGVFCNCDPEWIRGAFVRDGAMNLDACHLLVASNRQYSMPTIPREQRPKTTAAARHDRLEDWATTWHFHLTIRGVQRVRLDPTCMRTGFEGPLHAARAFQISAKTYSSRIST